MFLQICLLTAGLHFGRRLLKGWGPPEAEAPGDAGPPEETGASVAPAPEDTLKAAPPASEAAAVQEQFELALVSTGLTAAASLFLPRLRFLGGVAVMYESLPIFEKARRLLVDERRIGIEVLDSIGLIASIAVRQYTISAVMFLVYAGAQKLRLKTEGAARQSMLEVFGKRSAEVWVLADGAETRVPLPSLRIGDIMVLMAGGPIPADGVVVAGGALVDQHMLTGELQPAEKAEGDKVFAMTVVLSGRLHVRVEKAGEETVAAEISQILQNTADFASSIELESKKLADASALPILALSALAYPLVGPHGAVAMLNIGIADNMRVIAPFSMLNYLRKAYDTGILIKEGRSLQLLPKVDTVVFDKTGTLTQEQLHVRQVHTFGDADEAAVLTCAAAAEHRQSHPIARAILEEAERRGYSPEVAEDAQVEVGFGLIARVGGRTVLVGSRRFLSSQRLDLPASLGEAEEGMYRRGSSLVYVACEGALIGVIELLPVLRPEVESVLRALRKRDISLYLLSGDHEEPTRAIAEALGFDRYFAGILPRDKARIIEELQAQGRTVCFVGDGINDAIALKRAAVSVSLRGASAVASDSAQILLLEQGLGKLPDLFILAGDLERNLNGILLSALVPAAIAVGGVLLGGFRTNAVAAIYLMSMASGMTVATWPHREKLLPALSTT